MMRITRIEPVTKTKYRVSVDEQFAFVVYKGELSRFHLKEECELTEDTYAKIKEVLLKRAKLRAMHLLNDMARTESQLRDKLKLGGYPSEITEAAIAYVKSFGYINDDAYIRNFIDSRKDKKSRREIYALLRQKGVDMNRAEEIMEEMYEEYSDQEAIRKLLRKKALGLCLYRSERKAENIWIFGAERISLRRYPSSNTSLRLECLTYL